MEMNSILNFSHSQDAYKHQNPYGINPVLLNDVIFTLHAIVITAVTISQCFIYEVINILTLPKIYFPINEQICEN